jgi:hypothetical protein
MGFRAPTYRTIATNVVLAVLLACGVAAQARADTLDGALEVRSAYINVDEGVFKLSAKIDYPVNDDIRTALKDGITLTFNLDLVVSRERRYWVDDDVAEYSLRREMTYHTVSDRYVIREPRSGEQQSYASVDEALQALGNVDAWPILVQPQLVPGGRYRVAVRAGVRRGRLSDTLRVLLFWTDDWHRESEWYSWSLPR